MEEESSIKKLVEFEDEMGDYTAVWEDVEEDVIIVQYNFIHLTLEPDEFSGFASALEQARRELADKQE